MLHKDQVREKATSSSEKAALQSDMNQIFDKEILSKNFVIINLDNSYTYILVFLLFCYFVALMCTLGNFYWQNLTSKNN